jgi:outer membrane cobalamin receptor
MLAIGVRLRLIAVFSVLLGLLFIADLAATIFGSVRGTVIDAQNRPVAGVVVTLGGASAQGTQTARTGADGAFRFGAVPLGSYRVKAEGGGLSGSQMDVTVASGAATEITLRMANQSVTENMTVVGSAPVVDPRSSTTQTAVSREEITETAGADRSNSVAMITSRVPGSYVVHDQLHIRGGHQVDWLVDGVPVPNTNIASNVGPQFDPKDVQTLEVERGGFSAEYGDRTYGVFNVVPQTGFNRDREGDLSLSFGTHRSTNDQVSVGDHTERTAYYLSANANRTDLGLETPIPTNLHNNASGGGLFTTLVLLPTASDQLRMVGSLRRDDYQIPNDEALQAEDVRDRQREADTFLNLTWARMQSTTGLLTISPFFHDNTADFEGGPNDPLTADDRRRSQYLGAQISYSNSMQKNDWRAGAFGFAQHDDVRFTIRENGGDALSLSQSEHPRGTLGALFAEDQFNALSWLTLRAGVRATRFSGSDRETAISPRAGVAVHLPWQGAVLRASYGQYYQAPPLSTISGPLLQFALDQGFGFLPLRGERDRQAELGVGIPIAGWAVDFSAFRTEARSFFDHDVLGNSNIFFPLTIDRAHIRGIESTVQSPAGARMQVHLAYSHQTVEGEGGIAGGLTDFTPPEEGRFLLDHDQRNTLAAGVTWRLPREAWVGVTLNYGSGFLEGDGPAHLPPHTTLDVATGERIGSWSLKLSAVNLTNKEYLLDQSNTFGGTHFAEPREISASVGYRFHY